MLRPQLWTIPAPPPSVYDALSAKTDRLRRRLHEAAAAHQRVKLASSLAVEDMVITHLIAAEKLPIAVFTLQTGRLNAFQTALTRNAGVLLAAKKQRLEKQAALLDAVSPQHILARGFSVVRNTRGQVVRDAAALKQGQTLHITFAEGEAAVRVSSDTAQPDLFDFS